MMYAKMKDETVFVMLYEMTMCGCGKINKLG